MEENYSLSEIAKMYGMNAQELYLENKDKFKETYFSWTNTPKGLVSMESIPKGMILENPLNDKRFYAPGKVDSTIHHNNTDIENTSTQDYDNNHASCDTPPWMTIAINQAKEIGGRNEKQVDAIIRKYHKSATGSELNGANTAWCASFVSWALKESGMENTPRSAGSRFFRDESENSHFGKGLKPIPEGEEKLGDIAVWADLNNNGEHKGSGHVAFVFGKDADGDNLFLGGNQGNTLGVKEYSTEKESNREFVGYFRPEEVQNTYSSCDLAQYSSVAVANEAAIGQEIEIGDTTR